MSVRAALALVAAATFIALPAQSQQRTRILVEADSAYDAGNLALADSLYYIAVRYWPRDPGARTALGRYLGAQGKIRPAVVLLEEARMFGGDPVEIGRHLAPLYERLGEWRALLTLPGSPLSIAERRRAAWLSERPSSFNGDGAIAVTVGMPEADTIARVQARLGGRTLRAVIVASDAGVVLGTGVAGNFARRFEGDPTIVVLDSVVIGDARLNNVPAAIGVDTSMFAIGVGTFGPRIVQVDYARNRIVIAPDDRAKAQGRYMLARVDGQMRVLDAQRWVSLSDFASAVARMKRTLVIDLARGEVRIRL